MDKTVISDYPTLPVSDDWATQSKNANDMRVSHSFGTREWARAVSVLAPHHTELLAGQLKATHIGKYFAGAVRRHVEEAQDGHGL